MNAYREKFSKKSDLAFSSQNHIWDGVGLEGEEEEEDALEWRGFRDGMDLRLGAMMQLTQEGERERGRERERERDRIRKAPNIFNIKR